MWYISFWGAPEISEVRRDYAWPGVFTTQLLKIGVGVGANKGSTSNILKVEFAWVMRDDARAMRPAPLDAM